jgi:hypothetical protein
MWSMGFEPFTDTNKQASIATEAHMLTYPISWTKHSYIKYLFDLIIILCFKNIRNLFREYINLPYKRW